MRDLLRDLFWNGTWPNETAPTIPATPMKSAYYFIYIIYIYYICILLYILLWCCSVTQVKLAHPGLKLPSQALEVASTDAVVDMSRAGSLAGNWQPRTSKRFPIAMILPWFCHDFATILPWCFISIHTFSIIFHGFPLYWRPLWTDSSSKSMLVTMAVGISIILVLTTLQMGASDSLNKRSGSTAVHMSITSSIFNIDYSECRHCSHSYAILESVDSPSITMGTCWVFPF